MALSERMLAARCNTEDHLVVDHRTWVLAGDGDLMEGISHEAASLAGRLGLGRLTVVYDDNGITIDGPATQPCTDDPIARFAAYGWHVLAVPDGNDHAQLGRAYEDALAEESKPTLIAARTTIGYGAPTVAGTSDAHGSPLGERRLHAMRERFDWPAQRFHVPDLVAAYCRELARNGAAQRAAWQGRVGRWQAEHPDLAKSWQLDGVPAPPDLDTPWLSAFDSDTSMATRKASGAVLNTLASTYPALVGGSADLAGSTNSDIGGGDVTAGSFAGRTIHFGIREHAMGGMLNGMASHGGLRPYGSTFLVFSDYMRPSIRLAALMCLPVIFIFTHDSIAVGEDGPTHQPVEHIESLRLIPGLAVLRPADAHETAACWRIAVERTEGPTALILSRQNLAVLDGCDHAAVRHEGMRVVRRPAGPADVVLAASGSEVALAMSAAARLTELRLATEVWSVPWRERLEQVPVRQSGRNVLPTVWIEAGVPTGWRALAAPGDEIVGLSRFGASAPGAVVVDKLGLNIDRVVAAALRATAGTRGDR